MRRFAWILLVFGMSLFGLAAVAQESSGPVNIAFIFDASGSMRAGMEGRTRLAVAQDALTNLSAGLPPGTNASLLVYGHRLSQDDPAASCQDIEQVIELGPVDAAQFESVVRGINAIGYTPISDSLQLAAQTLVDRADERNTIVLVSDGEETCGGSPCLMAQALKAANIELTVNTIGFAADDVTRQQLECIADVTGGTYFDAPDAQQLTEALEAAVAAPGTVQVVDANGDVQWEMDFTLETVDSGETVGSFLGTATVPAGEYRAIVPGEPAVDVVVTVNSGETATIVVTPREGTGIRMVNLAGDPLPDLSFSLADPVTGAPLYGTGMLELLPGDYSVEVNTAFPQVFDVTVPEGVMVSVPVNDAQGLIRIVDLAGDPLPEMYFNVVDPVSGESVYGQGEMPVPPGQYPVQVRTVFDTFTEATVEDGQTVDVPVDPAFGTIALVDLAGELLADVSFNITDPATGEIHYAQGELNVPPGTYAVNVPLPLPVNVEVGIVDGQRLEIPINNEIGVIRVVDLEGNLIPDLSFSIIDDSTGDVDYGTGEFQLPPGEYTVEVNWIVPFSTPVVVLTGEITDITVDTTAGTIQLVDEDGVPLDEQLFRVVNADTDESTAGRGPVEVPPGTYTVEVFTAITFETEVSVTAGETTEVVVGAEGTIQLVDEDGAPLDSQLFTVTNVETGESTAGRGPVEVPPGTYTVEVFTVFPFETEVDVTAGETTEVTVSTAAGVIQLVDEDGAPLDSQLFSSTNVMTGDSTASRGPVEVPPGTYTVEVFTVFPFETEVDVTAGETTEVTVSTAAGTIQLVDEDGAPLDGQLFTATNVETGESTAGRGPVEVPPGTYTVEVFTVFPFETEVGVTAGETTEVTVSTAAGTIQLVDQDGTPLGGQLFTAANAETGEATAATGSIDVPPGTYTLEVYTVFILTTEVEVLTGETTEVTINTAAGTIRMVDGRGRAQPSMLFTVERLDSDDRTSASGEIEVPPGLYHLSIYADKAFELDVEVVESEVTAVNVQNQSSDRPAP